MIKQLEEAIEKMRQLPEDEQAVLARFMLHELEEDLSWRQTTEDHAGTLAALVDEIAAEDARGDCRDLDVDEL